MNKRTKYLLDTNVLIDAYDEYYAPDIVPSFWKEIQSLHVVTISDVLVELKAVLGRRGEENDDEYGDSGSDKPHELLTRASKIRNVPSDHDEPVIKEIFNKIERHVSGHKKYSKESTVKFLAKADPWLIAVAKVYGHTVVTHEKEVGPESTYVKIPNVCNEFGVAWMNVFDMLRGLGIKW